MDIGVWVPPSPRYQAKTSLDCSRGHQGPSRLRRRERKAATRAAAYTTEEVVAVAEVTPEEPLKINTKVALQANREIVFEDESVPVPRKGYTFSQGTSLAMWTEVFSVPKDQSATLLYRAGLQQLYCLIN